MISLLRADLFKTRKRAMGWVMLAIIALTIVVVMLNSALQNPSHVTYAFPGGLLAVSTVLQLLGVLVLIIEFLHSTICHRPERESAGAGGGEPQAASATIPPSSFPSWPD